jgi:hypothetical protein
MRTLFKRVIQEKDEDTSYCEWIMMLIKWISFSGIFLFIILILYADLKKNI